MKMSKVRTVRGYRALFGILGALLLSLPANAAWKPMATPPVPTGYAAAESINVGFHIRLPRGIFR